MDLRYPIGSFKLDGTPTDEQIKQAINEIGEAPAKLRAAVEGLTSEQLETPYRPGGWTVRQVVHHVPDSHLNSYCRFKLALTEDEPTIKAYHEDRWAELGDVRSAPIEVSLALLESLHERWVWLLKSRRRISRERFGTRRLELSVWPRARAFTPGMAGIMLRTSLRCASGCDGSSSWEGHSARMRQLRSLVP